MSTATLAPPAPIEATVGISEFLAKHGDESGVELVDGIIRRLEMPGTRHGWHCMNAGAIFHRFVTERNLGRVFSNDTFIYTRRDPDGCRGADVCFVGYETIPADAVLSDGPLSPPIDLVVEVRSKHDSIGEMTTKAIEYLAAGVRVVLVLDPFSRVAGIFRPDELPMRLGNGDELSLPDILPGFAMPVSKFFE